MIKDLSNIHKDKNSNLITADLIQKKKNCTENSSGS